MKSDKSIVKTIFGGLNFTNSETELISSVFHKIKIKKGETLFEPNVVVDVQFYIYSGCLRTFYTDSHGKEFTLQIGIADWWISDFTAYFSTDKATMAVEAIQNSTLYKISRNDQELLLKKIPKVEHFFRVKLERAFAGFQKRILGELSKTAKQRYLDFLKQYPSTERIIKNYHIASYLGITNESLSRIRKELSEN